MTLETWYFLWSLLRHSFFPGNIFRHFSKMASKLPAVFWVCFPLYTECTATYPSKAFSLTRLFSVSLAEAPSVPLALPCFFLMISAASAPIVASMSSGSTSSNQRSSLQQQRMRWDYQTYLFLLNKWVNVSANIYILCWLRLLGFKLLLLSCL